MKSDILVITYDYSPLVTPNSFRWSSVAELLAIRRHRVFVISAWKPGFKREETLNGVQVFRVGGGLMETFRARLLKQGAVYNQKSIALDAGRIGGPSGILKKIHDATWKKIYWPDFACAWYLPAMKMAEALMTREHISCCVTVSLPFTSHLVGSRLKVKHPDSKWIVDISDPFCFLRSMKYNNQLFYSGLNMRAERKIFLRANAISVLTKAQKDRYSELFPESSGKIFVNPNILPSFEQNLPALRVFRGSSRLRLVFIGTLNKTVRSPETLLKMFALLMNTGLSDKLELHFFGSVEHCLDCFSEYERLLGKKIFLHGVVPRGKAVRAMREADSLINIGNSNPYQEPSKVVEYASTGKPIINIMTIEDDSSAFFLERYPACLNVRREELSQSNLLASKLEQFILSPPVVDRASLDIWLLPYRTESVADNYEAMLGGLIQ